MKRFNTNRWDIVVRMGLDAFWETPKGKRKPQFVPELSLRNCWKMDDGDYTFGDYSTVLFALSGVPQHDRCVSSYSVQTIASRFKETTRKDFVDSTGYLISAKEWNELKRMFIAYAKVGASYRVSW